MNYRKSFSAMLKHLRLSRGISQTTLAQHLGVTFQAISMMESGKRAPSFEILCHLADYFDVSIDYLVGRTEFPLILKDETIEILSPKDMEALNRLRKKKD